MISFGAMNPGESKKLCEDCTVCCDHVAIEIDTPETKEYFEDIIWYVLHGINVYLDNEDCWNIEIMQKCKALDKKGVCKIYSERPAICRNYSHEECERYGAGRYYKKMFKNRKNVLKFMKTIS